jgi:hypothetical protein
LQAFFILGWGIHNAEPPRKAEQPISDVPNGSVYALVDLTTRMGFVRGLDENTRKTVATAPKGATCNNPVYWNEADQHIDQTWVVVGPVIKVTQRDDLQGKPTLVDIGGVYPAAKRLSLIVSNDPQTGRSVIEPTQVEGRLICVIGKITSNQGVPQMELKYPSQFTVQMI